MYVLCVTVFVKSDKITDFLAATRSYAALVRTEPGNVRYDILQSDEDDACFVIYEAYKTKDDFLYHRETAHSQRWKEQIAPWMAMPRTRIRCNSIIFGDEQRP